MQESLNKKVVRSTKWLAVTEIASKIVTPISSMVLARLLTPEAFGVVTTITMIITFAEVFTDAGFQKYLIQHEFSDDSDRIQSTNVAFWSNFTISILIWMIIVVFCEPLAIMVGNPGLGKEVAIACAVIPLAAFSSIQMALYKRDFDFKTLFKVRIVAICIPLFVTIPCAIFFRNYWALIIGIIGRDLASAILLTWYSKWKPQLYYSFAKLKEMFSFTLWSLIEAISIWLTTYVDVFMVGTLLNPHYLGLYKTSTAIVAQMMHLVTAATTPVLFSSLSRLQNNEEEFKEMFFKFQKAVGVLIVPLGFGIYLFSDMLTEIFLGGQWREAAGFIGLWGLTSSFTIIFSHYSSEIYRAKGKPRLSVLAQWLHILVLWPTVYFFIRYGFEVLCTARALVRLELIMVNLLITFFAFNISPLDMLKNTYPCIISAIIMMLTVLLLRLFDDSMIFQFLEIAICVIVYFAIIGLFPPDRKLLLAVLKRKI